MNWILMNAITRRIVAALAITITATAGGCGGQAVTDPQPLESAEQPARALFVTRDIENFWAAYDAGGRNGAHGARCVPARQRETARQYPHNRCP
ncbi:MAG: hypothetical protein ACREMA_10175 [Longimicrobiales bacterium]